MLKFRCSHVLHQTLFLQRELNKTSRINILNCVDTRVTVILGCWVGRRGTTITATMFHHRMSSHYACLQE